MVSSHLIHLIVSYLYSSQNWAILSYRQMFIYLTRRVNSIYFICPRLGEMLGSGQFGDVFRGVWKSNDGDVEVAVKTLKEEAGDEDRIKFLQEATIMGQFKHPSVVTMHGVVAADEPASCSSQLK